MVVLLNLVNTGGEYLLSKLVLPEASKAADRQAFIGHFYGAFFTCVGLGGLVLQSFVVSRLFRWVGVRGAPFFLPTVALGGYCHVVLGPALSVALTTRY